MANDRRSARMVDMESWPTYPEDDQRTPEQKQKDELEIERTIEKDRLSNLLDNWQAPDSARIPAHMKEAVVDYVVHGYYPGDFLRAVLRNDLCDALGRADPNNFNALRSWVSFMYNEIPSEAWGSQEKIEKWCEKKLLGGLSVMVRGGIPKLDMILHDRHIKKKKGAI